MITLAIDLFDGSFWAGIATTMGLLLIGHWLPMPSLVPPVIGRLCRYAYGTASIMAGVMVWLLTQRLPELAIGVVLIGCAGGVAVFSAYTVDWIVSLVKKGLKAERLLRDERE